VAPTIDYVGRSHLTTKRKMERLEADRRFFTQQLAIERDQFRRNLILGQIRDIDVQILHLLRQERARVERENQNLEEMLNFAIKMKKK
jgi:hypothetical protein